MTFVGFGMGFSGNTYDPGADVPAALVQENLISLIDPSNFTTWSDGSAITDASGNDNGVTQGTEENQPSLDTLPYKGNRVIDFDGSNDTMTYGPTVGGQDFMCEAGNAFSFYTVFELTDRQSMVFAKSGGNFSFRQFALGSFDSGSDNIQLYIRGTGNTVISGGVGSGAYAFGFVWDGTTATAYVMGEGESEWTEVACTVGGGGLNGDDVRLGSRSGGTTDVIDGWIGKTAVYDAAHTEDEIAQNGRHYAQNFVNKTPDLGFLLLGSSILFRAFENINNYLEVQRAVGLERGKYVKFRMDTDNGRTTQGLLSDLPSIITANPYEPGYRQIALIHTWGNDVSNTRPFNSATQTEKDNITNGLTDICDDLEAEGWEICLPDGTFRLYTSNTILDESEGMKPYDDILVQPIRETYGHRFLRDDNTNYLEWYDLIKNDYDTKLDPDGIHPNGTGLSDLRVDLKESLIYPIFDGIEPDTIEIKTPVYYEAPTFSGTETEGETLTGSNADYINGASSYEYKWQVSDDGSTGWSDISGATSISFVLTATEANKYVRFGERPTNASGVGEWNYSAASGQISASSSEPSGDQVVVSFGSSDSGGNINWITGSPSAGSQGSLIDTSGVTTSYSIAWNDDFQGTIATNGGSGDTTDTITNSDLQGTAVYAATGSGADVLFTLSGLPTNADIRIKFVGSRAGTGTRNQTVNINSEGDVTNNVFDDPPTVLEVDTTTDGSGEATVYVREANGNNAYYICGIEFQLFS